MLEDKITARIIECIGNHYKSDNSLYLHFETAIRPRNMVTYSEKYKPFHYPPSSFLAMSHQNRLWQ